jgi:hypothetical protein
MVSKKWIDAIEKLKKAKVSLLEMVVNFDNEDEHEFFEDMKYASKKGITVTIYPPKNEKS